MVRFIIILFFVVFSFGSEVINISYFPSNEKVDVLFSLDEPFKGNINKIGENDYKITQVSLNRIEQKKFKKLNIIISPLNKTDIELKVVYDKDISIKASITAKGYGLRIRITGIKEIKQKLVLPTQQPSQESFNFVNYFIVIAILIILIIILFIVKKKTIQNLPKALQNDGYKVLYQKMIDPKNKLVLIEVFNKKYLLLLGANNNILLDNFSQQNQEELQEISSQSEFEGLLDKKINNEFIENASKLKEENEF